MRQAISPVDWQNADTSVLLNPRMPAAQRDALLSAQRQLPTLAAHVWVTTSGSTGGPGGIKWVALSKDALLLSAQAVNAHLQSTRADIWTLALPTFHVGGLGVLARAFLSGAPVLSYAGEGGERAWNASAFAGFLAETRSTLTTLVPTQLHDLVRAGLPSPSNLRAVVVGGGALSAHLYAEARALGWPVLPSYGLSECCSQVATASLSSLASDDFAMLPALELLFHVRAKTDDAGRIALQSGSLLTGYGLLDGPNGAKTGPRFVNPTEGGWLLTEDRGVVSGRQLEVLGRADEVVKVGGELVDIASLGRLWEMLCPPQDGLETALVAVPDARLGARVTVAAAGRANLQGMLVRCMMDFNGRVAPFERVQGVVWVDALPRSPLGKVLRGALLGQIMAQTR